MSVKRIKKQEHKSKTISKNQDKYKESKLYVLNSYFLVFEFNCCYYICSSNCNSI